MTGAAIVRWETGRTVVLAVHGAFDGACAWALRIAMEESHASEFVIDLTHAEEAFDFAASLLAAWTRRWGRTKRVAFRPGTDAHARLLAGHGLDAPEEAEMIEPALSPLAGASPRGLTA